MCGILCILHNTSIHPQNLTTAELAIHATNSHSQQCLSADSFLQSLNNRGPDHLAKTKIDLDREGISIDLVASLLQMRSKRKSPALFIDSRDNVLAFNGEIYNNIERDSNDAELLSLALESVSDEQTLVDVLIKLLGPWTFVYWWRSKKELWFGRDCSGRRSLLLHYNADYLQCILSSTADLGPDEEFIHCIEVPPGIYKIQFASQTNAAHINKAWAWPNSRPLRSLCFSNLLEATEALLAKLRRSIQIRFQAAEIVNDGQSSPVLVPFSGGVDSTLIAALLNEVVPLSFPIDLCNVSFDKEHAPDRQNSIQAFEDLCSWAPMREWRLICVNESLESIEAFKDRIKKLIRPCSTIMDLNIGSALWLAARAQGWLYPSGTAYTSTARIVFVGHGADEQCAGYGRHRTIFRERGWNGLDDELNREMARLWERNIGRDDRLISDHGREARLPYLDEDLVAFLKNISLTYLFDASKPRGKGSLFIDVVDVVLQGFGEKIILREALRHIGLTRVATKEKRAIQFGTHIAKLTNKQRFGSNRNANKHHAGDVLIE